jgi:hypothetical protein
VSLCDQPQRELAQTSHWIISSLTQQMHALRLGFRHSRSPYMEMLAGN